MNTTTLVSKLDIFQKLMVYYHYRVQMTALKYDYLLLDKTPINKINSTLPYNHGYGKPDKEVHNIAFFFLWKNMNIMSFEEFVSDDNIRVINHGKEWEARGFAQEIQTDYFGIYEWVWKFPESIQNR